MTTHNDKTDLAIAVPNIEIAWDSKSKIFFNFINAGKDDYDTVLDNIKYTVCSN